MEWAILIPGSGTLSLLPEVLSGAPPQDGATAEWLAVQACRGTAAFTRLYFGCEFCERRIPSLTDLQRAIAMAAEHGLDFTLVTPYVDEDGLRQVEALLALLAECCPEAEVLVNDFGVLHALRSGGYRFPVVLGRLMNRMIRDPRVADYYAAPGAPGEALTALRQSGVAAPAYQQVLQRKAVARVELDNLIQGFDISFSDETMAGSLHLPYGVVTTTRHCMIGSLNQPKELKFVPGVACRQQCQQYTFAMDPAQARPDQPQRPMWLKGNTVFYGQDPDLITRGYAQATAMGISRVVYHPLLPL